MKHTLGIGALLFVLSACGSAAQGGSPSEVGEGIEPAASVEDHLVTEPPLEEMSTVSTHPKVAFVAATGCEGLTGTWRAQVYSEPHVGYYEFTAHVSQPSTERASLNGTIVARSWNAAEDDVSPPDACEGAEAFHWTVEEPATGGVQDDGSISFVASSWKEAEHFCGAAVTDYSPDELVGLHAAGTANETTTLVGTVQDHGVWAEGRPIELTRISCE